MKTVGHGRPIHDAEGKAAGYTKYAADIMLPGMTHICLIRSTIPHGRVKAVHADKALNVPGVYGVFHCFNTTGRAFNRYRAHFSQDLPDEERAFTDYVRFVGDRVGAVAACDRETAVRAAGLVEVEYEELPHSVGFDDTLAGKNCLEGESIIKDEYISEDGEPVYADDAVEVDSFSEIPRLHHAAMEPHACVVDYDPYQEQMTIYSPNQSVHGIRTTVAKFLEMPFHRIRVVKTTMGGSFGAKQEWFVEPVAALVAKLLGRPVKLVYTRAEAMTGACVRGAMRVQIHSRFSPDGTFLSMNVDVILDAGAYMGNSRSYIRALCGRLFRCYRIPHLVFRGRVISSNTPVSGGFRGWSGPEAAIFMEHHMDAAARKLNMDRISLRMKNVQQPGGYDIHMKLPLENICIGKAILRGQEFICWDRLIKENREFNNNNQRFRRGVGIGCGGLGNTYLPVHPDSGEGWMQLNEDGTAQLKVTAHDHGCGTVTMLRMIAAEVLDMPVDDIYLTEGDTASTPVDVGCYSSRTTFVLGRTVYETAMLLKKKMLDNASALASIPVQSLYVENAGIYHRDTKRLIYSYRELSQQSIYRLRRNVSAQAQFYNETNPGVTGAHFAHVEVDTWTGYVRVLDYVAVHDIGQPINPDMCIAQIQGAAQMGCGAALSEAVQVMPNGTCSRSFSKYHLMLAPNLPEIRVELLEDGRSSEGPFGAKSIGEVSYVPAAPAVCSAVNDALGSNMGVLPFNPDAILKYLSTGRSS